MEKYVIDNNYMRLTAFTPIACKQAHGAVVLCEHNPTDIEVLFKIYHLL